MKVRTILLTGTLVGIISLSGAAGEIVEIRLRGHYFSAPATVQMTVAVEPDPANRVLRIQADGDGEFHSTEVELTGETEKRLHLVEFKNLPAGNYELRAEVLATRERVRASAVHPLVVDGPPVAPGYRK